jgi:hypothetical protein
MVMKQSSIIVLLLILAIKFPISAQRHNKTPLLKPSKIVKLKVQEPSDLTSTHKDELIFVSDNGYFSKTDYLGSSYTKGKFTGVDFEGICFDGQYLYLVEEFTSRVHKINPVSLERIQTFQINFQGGRNDGFEAIAYNPNEKCFYLISEHSPNLIKSDLEFKTIDIVELSSIGEVSGAVWHQDQLWVLSDENRTISILSTSTYLKEREFKINVNNPEGITISKTGQLLICSDDDRKLYYFDLPK